MAVNITDEQTEKLRKLAKEIAPNLAKRIFDISKFNYDYIEKRGIDFSLTGSAEFQLFLARLPYEVITELSKLEYQEAKKRGLAE